MDVDEYAFATLFWNYDAEPFEHVEELDGAGLPVQPGFVLLINGRGVRFCHSDFEGLFEHILDGVWYFVGFQEAIDLVMDQLVELGIVGVLID